MQFYLYDLSKPLETIYFTVEEFYEIAIFILFTSNKIFHIVEKLICDFLIDDSKKYVSHQIKDNDPNLNRQDCYHKHAISVFFHNVCRRVKNEIIRLNVDPRHPWLKRTSFWMQRTICTPIIVPLKRGFPFHWYNHLISIFLQTTN